MSLTIAVPAISGFMFYINTLHRLSVVSRGIPAA
jgi:hypothetical protein